MAIGLSGGHHPLCTRIPLCARPPGASKFTLTLEEVHVVNDIARAHVRITYTVPQGGSQDARTITFIEGRFYRQVGDRWLLTSRVKEMLGRSQELWTEHFRIRYSEMDRDAVHAAAPELEAMYIRLLETLNLAPSLVAEHYGTGIDGQIEFNIVPYAVDGFDRNKPMTTITSPFFDQTSPDIEPGAHLSYVMFQALVHPVISERLAFEAFRTWGPITWGIRHWLAEDALAGWSGTSTHFDKESQAEALLEHYPVHLTALKALDGATNGTAGMGIGFALVEFVVDTYGRGFIVPLLNAMDEENTWEEVNRITLPWMARHFGGFIPISLNYKIHVILKTPRLTYLVNSLLFWAGCHEEKTMPVPPQPKRVWP